MLQLYPTIKWLNLIVKCDLFIFTVEINISERLGHEFVIIKMDKYVRYI